MSTPHIPGLADLVEVGRGGFGTVFRASDERFGRRVAVKVIRDAGLGKDVVARFERECRALGSLSGHPNIVAVHDSGQTSDGDLYLVMEYLAGGSLTQRTAARGVASPQEVVRWGAALAGALETAHRSGIVHRDVKPENVLFSEYGAVKLVDFGIARMRTAYETRSGFISATLNHAAPEVVAGSKVTPSADIYSLASVLFTTLYGRAPFDRGDEESLAPMIARISSAAPPDLREYGVPAPVAEVIERGLSKAPGERFESAAELGFALKTAGRAIGAGDVAVPLGDAEDVAEAAAVVQSGPPTPTGDHPLPMDTAAVARRRQPVPERVPVTAAPPGNRRRKVVAGIAAALVLLGGGGAYAARTMGDDGRAGVDAGAGDAGAGSEGVAASEAELVRVSDDASTTAGLRSKREYTITPKGQVGSTITFTNITDKPVTRLWAEVVPKQLALAVKDVTFSRSPDQIIDRDPIVMWRLTIKPHDEQTLAWRTALPKDGSVTERYLRRAIRWHRQALANSARQISAALTDAADKGPGTAVPVGQTVDGGLPPATGGSGPYIDPYAGSGGPTGSAGSGATSGAGGGGTTGTGSTGGGGAGGGGAPPPTPNRPPVVDVSNRTTDELASVSFSIGVSDPDGDSVSVSVTGLPSGVSSRGAAVSGRVSYSAASVTTDRRNGIQSRTFSVTVTATDTKGATTRRSFSWVVRDTHRTMPNYIGAEGCGGCQGLPDVAAISTPAFDCAYDPNGDGNHIWRQSVAANSVIRWGQSIQYWYGKNDSSCPHVAKGW